MDTRIYRVSAFSLSARGVIRDYTGVIRVYTGDIRDYMRWIRVSTAYPPGAGDTPGYGFLAVIFLSFPGLDLLINFEIEVVEPMFSARAINLFVRR